MRARLTDVALILALSSSALAFAQETATTVPDQIDTTATAPAPIRRDQQAVTLANQAYQAMTGGTQVQDATLQGTASWVSGSVQETGPATLEAKGSQQSRILLSLTGGQRHEIRNSPISYTAAASSGAWAGSDGNWYASALHNCWTDASWFFPAFTLQSALNDPSISMIYVGPESFAGIPALHLVFYRTLTAQSVPTVSLVQRLSTMHVFFDAKSGLPIGFRFNTHPDDEAGLDIPVEIHFSNYKQANGGQVPFHIQKFLQGSLLLDLYVTAVQIDSGLPDSNFSIPATAAVTGGLQ
jgi:hypothetical protein